MSDGMRDSSGGLSAYLFGTHDTLPEVSPKRELEKLLDALKCYSQQAGIAQQKAITNVGSKDDTVAWLERAEASRAEIIAFVGACVVEAVERGGRVSLSTTAPAATTTHARWLFREFGKKESEQAADDLRIYRVEGGPTDMQLIGVWTNGTRMFLASAGTHPIEPEPMTWADAQDL